MAWTIIPPPCPANSLRSPHSPLSAPSTIGRVGRQVGRDLHLPAIAIREQLLLVVKELLPRLGRKFEIRSLDDRIHGAGLLAEPAINALRHVDVVARRTTAPVGARLRLDRDGQRRTNRFAKLARDTALFTIRVTPECVLAAKAGLERTLLIWVVERDLLLEHILEGQPEPFNKLAEEKRSRRAVENRHLRSPVTGGPRRIGHH